WPAAGQPRASRPKRCTGSTPPCWTVWPALPAKPRQKAPATPPATALSRRASAARLRFGQTRLPEFDDVLVALEQLARRAAFLAGRRTHEALAIGQHGHVHEQDQKKKKSHDAWGKKTSVRQ